MDLTLLTNEKFPEVDGTAGMDCAVIRIRVWDVSDFLKDKGFPLCTLSKACSPMNKKKIKEGLHSALQSASINTQHILS